MSDTQLIQQNLTGAVTVPPGAWHATSFGTLQYAAPVIVAGAGIVGNGFAGGVAAAAQVVGLSLNECAAAGDSTYVTPLTGPVDFTTEQWDNVTGQTGGLTPGAAYYLSAAVAGKLTTTAPSGVGDFIVYIGVGRDPTTMILNIQTLGAQVPTPQPIIG